MRFLINYSWTILWSIIVLILISLPSNDFNGVSTFEGFDKLVHTGFFFVFTVLSYFGSVLQSKRRATKLKTSIIIILIALSFAFLTEGIQLYLITTRSADWWDIFADTVGIGMGVFAYSLLYHKRTI